MDQWKPLRTAPQGVPIKLRKYPLLAGKPTLDAVAVLNCTGEEATRLKFTDATHWAPASPADVFRASQNPRDPDEQQA